jgi:hypothetical protein
LPPLAEEPASRRTPASPRPGAPATQRFGAPGAPRPGGPGGTQPRDPPRGPASTENWTHSERMRRRSARRMRLREVIGGGVEGEGELAGGVRPGATGEDGGVETAA